MMGLAPECPVAGSTRKRPPIWRPLAYHDTTYRLTILAPRMAPGPFEDLKSPCSWGTRNGGAESQSACRGSLRPLGIGSAPRERH
jgi:hypothetical protein